MLDLLEDATRTPDALREPPLPLGPFEVERSGERSGELTPRDPARLPALCFAWRGRPVEAALAPDGLRMSIIGWRVPSTSEHWADRDSAFATLRDLPGSLPPGWRIGLTPDHRIRLQAQVGDLPPTTATTLVAALVRFALALDPYLDRLDSTCVVVPGPEGGSAKT